MTEPRLRFGPAGNSESFYDAGFTQTVEAFSWLRETFSLGAFEIPFGRGISMSETTAMAIGEKARQEGVVLSAHAPYYINLANPNPAMAEKSMGYIKNTARLLTLMGGERVVLHVGSPKDQPRDQALELCARRLKDTRAALIAAGYPQIRLCLETMGRPSVLGTLEEILTLTQVDDSFLPCVDFAHLHAAGGGAINDQDDFARVLDRIEEALGLPRARQMHMHFSRIEYGSKGEIRHRIFAETDYGPEFSLLAPLLARRGYQGILICESRGTQAEDAAHMQRSYLSHLGG